MLDNLLLSRRRQTMVPSEGSKFQGPPLEEAELRALCGFVMRGIFLESATSRNKTVGATGGRPSSETIGTTGTPGKHGAQRLNGSNDLNGYFC